MSGAFLGPEFTDHEIDFTARKFKAIADRYESFDALAETVAKFIANGNVVGWFQGRMEFGPRALGSRSIIGDSRDPQMQSRMNLKIKYRESFRPKIIFQLNPDCKIGLYLSQYQ